MKVKAIQVPEAHKLLIIEKECPEIKNDFEVQVKVKRVGICGSDMHIYHGTNPLATYPRVVGHEVAGVVTAVGESVNTVQVGDHVVIEPISFCGKCYACRKGRQNVCKHLSVFGVHEDGGMQEVIVLPERQVHQVNKNLDWDEVVLAEPYTIGAQAVWRGKVETGDTVLIQGSGPIGICILKMAKLSGAIVMMTDLDEKRLEFAKENGADFILNAGKVSITEEVMKITDGEGANIVIDAVCLPSTFEIGIQVASPAGRVVVLGFDERPGSVSQLPITKKELTVVGSRLQTNQFEKVITLLNEGKLKHNGLITHKFNLVDVKEAFDFIEKNPDEVRKACIMFD